jgi:polar amino acid transport system substrate-binding protein
VQADLLRREQSRCGSVRMEIITAPTNDDALLMLRTGQAAALPMDYPPAEELTTQPRTRANYQLASNIQYEPGVYGIGFAKNQQALRDTVQAALAELLKSGAYGAILQTWQVAAGAISQASINIATAR